MKITYDKHTLIMKSDKPYMEAVVHNPRDTISVQQYEFSEIHFKMPSEHTVEHQIQPLELQHIGTPNLAKSLVRPYHIEDGNVYRKCIISDLWKVGVDFFGNMDSLFEVLPLDDT